MYVHAGIEALPEELMGLASHVTILLPWGSLLKAVAIPELSLLKAVAGLCQPQATLKIIFGYDLQNEPNMIQAAGLPILTPEYLNTTFRSAYLEAGFNIRWKILSQDQLKNLPTTWAKKLAFGKKRQFIEIEAVINIR